MLLNIVTDEELLVSEVVKTILLIIISIGLILSLIRLIKSDSKSRQILNSLIFVSLSVLIFFVGKEFLLEGAFLENSTYVRGTTVGFCSVFALGKGIEFEYEVDGKKFRNCNTFYPVSKDSLKVPGGEFSVRYVKKFPDKGRMDFQKKAE